MRRCSRLVALAAAFMALAASANTLPALNAIVTAAGTYPSGAIYVFFDRPISSCSSSQRIDLPNEHPAKRQVLAVAMLALATGKSVTIHPGACDGPTPAFDQRGDAFFYLNAS